MTTYRGQQISHAIHNRKADTYSLISPTGECIAELKTREFLSFPNRNNVEIRSGRHRGAGSQNQRGANRKSGNSWYFDPGAIAQYDPSAFQSSPTSLIWSTWSSIKFDDEKPKLPLKREGIIAGEIIGYRCWRIENGWLRSVYQTDVWKPNAVLEGRELGDWDQRGIHAWKDPASKQYHDYIRSYLNDAETFHNVFVWTAIGREKPNSKPAMITGTVFLWGDVVEHERGWRAEFARVRSLDWLYPDETMMGREEETLNGLRALYGVLS